jgi:acyl-CoA thioesterase-1
MHYFEHSICMKRNYISAVIALLLVTACGGNQEKAAMEEKKEAAKEDNAAAGEAAVEKKNIIFFGNSLTAGYGLEPTQAFPALIQRKIDSLGLPYQVVNAGLSGETTAGGKNRIDWILKQPVDIFVLELGGNDGLRGIPISETRANLQEIIDRVRAKNPEVKIVLAGMQVPPNMGRRYAQEFQQLFRDLAQKNNTALIPFLLEGVGGIPELNLPDGIHPTAQGHGIVAENVWSVLKTVLKIED